MDSKVRIFEFLPGWRNWYTRTSQKRMAKALRVQISPRALYHWFLEERFEADPSATGPSEGGRLRRRSRECGAGGAEISPSRPFKKDTTMSGSFQDRRKHVRIYRNYVLTYHLKGKGNVKYGMSQVNNISRGGINFTASAPFEAGTEMVIEVKTPFLSDKIDFEGAVLDHREKIPGVLYEIRVQFHDLSPQAIEVMDKLERMFTPNK